MLIIMTVLLAIPLTAWLLTEVKSSNVWLCMSIGVLILALIEQPFEKEELDDRDN